MSLSGRRVGAINRGLILYLTSRFLTGTATQMQGVALTWIVYERTGSAFSLGMIGLALFLPSVLLVVPAGQAADRIDRRSVIAWALVGQAVCAMALLYGAGHSGKDMSAIYAAVVAVGAARAFSGPAFSSLLPEIVQADALPQAIAAGSSVSQVATIGGPAVGGLLYAWVGASTFLVIAAIHLVAMATLLGLPVITHRPSRSRTGNASPLAGLAYVVTNRLLLGAITLDLFAVLLGGVTSILPIFARDILKVGPAGLGLLRSGPAIGALLIGLVLMILPLRRRAGPTMLWAVAAYGAATVVFGLSTQFWLSFAAMVALGGLDMVSVVIRQTLEQMATPNAMRGRVSAVSSLFVGASNNLGGFESGVVASWIGAAPSAVVGGLGTVAVVILTAWLIPEIRRVNSLSDYYVLEIEDLAQPGGAKAGATQN